jgi:hypothetical protein
MYELDMIFAEWKAELREKDRSAKYVQSNFEEFFTTCIGAGFSFEEVQPYISKAYQAHLPPLSVAKKSYKDSKHLSKNAGLTEKEFLDQWYGDIEGKASAAFYSVYPRPKTQEEKDDDEEPKLYGNMSAKEYKLQRSHAEQFPRLDTEELERRQQAGTYNPLEELPLLLDKVNDGDSK